MLDLHSQKMVRRFAYVLIFWLAIVGTIATHDWYWIAAAFGVVGLHLVFRDTVNTFQWFPFWKPTSRMRRLYWMVRSHVSTATRVIERSSIYLMDDEGDPHTGEGVVPPFTGSGVKVRLGSVSVEVGFGRVRQSSVYKRDLDLDVDQIKSEFYNYYRSSGYVWKEEEASGTD